MGTVAAALVLALGTAPTPAIAAGPIVLRDIPPSPEETYCAWFGNRAGDTLYFGQAAFWTAYRSQGKDPRADLRASGPQRIGRVDLARERLLPALDVSAEDGRSGVWDVLHHPNGRVYFTTFFETSGWVDPLTGARKRLNALGTGLAELALATGGHLVGARYGRPGHPNGSIQRFSTEGFLVAEYPLRPPRGWRVAPKSVAYDPIREEVWALTDLLPEEGDGAIRHDTRVIDRFGRERLRLRDPEVQFVHFEPDGTGYLAEVEGASLYLRILPPGQTKKPFQQGHRVLLDTGFPAGFDFLQDLQIAEDGRVVATRWSGWVHVVTPAPEPDGGAQRAGADPAEGLRARVQTVRMPRLDDQGLYYTGVLRGERLCATYCSDLAVACQDLPPGN